MLLVSTIERRERDTHVFHVNRDLPSTPKITRKAARAIGRACCVDVETFGLYLHCGTERTPTNSSMEFRLYRATIPWAFVSIGK
jgi:hypothetical protein